MPFEVCPKTLKWYGYVLQHYKLSQEFLFSEGVQTTSKIRHQHSDAVTAVPELPREMSVWKDWAVFSERVLYSAYQLYHKYLCAKEHFLNTRFK